MPFAQANSTSLRIFQETVWGETPATPTMDEIKFTGESLSHSKETAQSNVIRTDRMRDDLLQVGVGAEGDINIELCYTDFDKLIEGTLGGTFTTITQVAASLQVIAATRKIIRATGSWISDGYKVGLWVKGQAFTAPGNNGYFRIQALTATDMTVYDPELALVDEASTPGRTMKSKWIRNGGTLPSFLIEKAFTDISKFISFVGCMVNQLQLNVTAKEIVTGSFGFMGKSGVSSNTTVSGSVNAAGNKTALTASSNIGHLFLDDVVFAAYVRTLQMTLSNNLRAQDAVGNLAHVGLAPGFFEAKGSIELFLADMTMYLKMENHTAFGFSMRFTDPSGNVMIFTFPKFYLGKSTANATGGNTDVMLSGEVEAVRDSATSCIVQVDVL
jgi:hypothetical protein